MQLIERIDDLGNTETPIQQEVIGYSAGALRFFSPGDKKDMTRLREISLSPSTRKWIDADGLTDRSLMRCAKESASKRRGHHEYLFAVCKAIDHRTTPDPGSIIGFIHFLSGKEQRQIHRELSFRGCIPKSMIRRPLYETYYAKHSDAPDHRMRKALSHACMELGVRQGRNIVVIAQIEVTNTQSILVAQKAGFEFLAETHSHERNGDGKWYHIYQLNWDKLDSVIRRDTLGEIHGPS